MAGVAAVKVKLMPEGIETDLKAISAEATLRINKFNPKTKVTIEEEPIAFGLKALIVSFAWSEELDSDLIQQNLETIPGVASFETLDFRRAFG